MLSKMQKTWTWIFAAMFIVPEVLFFITPMMFQAILGKSFLELSSWLVNYENFFGYPNYLLAVVSIEWIGVFGLLVINLKTNQKFSFKLPITILLIITLLWLALVFFYIYGFKDLGF